MSDTSSTPAATEGGTPSSDTSTADSDTAATTETTETAAGAEVEGQAAPEGTEAAKAETQEGAEAKKEETPPEEKKPDVDARLIALSKANRHLKGEVKTAKAEVETVRTEFEAYKGQVAPLIQLFESRHDDPIAFLNECGFDIDKTIAAYAGTKRELTTEEKLAKLQEQIAAREKREAEEKVEAEKRAADEKKKQEQKERERQIKAHISRIEDIATQNPERFPLTIEKGAFETVFDVMAVAWNNGSRITHEEALQAVEAEYEEELERLAKRKGLQKPKPPAAAQSTAATTQQTKAAPAKSLTTSLAGDAQPRGDSSPVRSDEELEADFLRTFGGSRAS
jgi:hypothetical protein